MTSAIYYESDGYTVGDNNIMGRKVAGNSFLKAYFKYVEDSQFWVYSSNKSGAEEFCKFARENGRQEEVKFIDFKNTGALREPGVLFYPGPDISLHCKRRSFYQKNTWSLCGITHTICSAKVMESIQSLVTSPVYPWDALICTSTVARSNIIKIFEVEEENLRHKLKASNFIRPQLPIIPLGIDSSEFKFTKAERNNAKNNFNIINNEIVILYVGRLSFHAKSNPFQMYSSLEEVARISKRKIVLIECGLYANEGIKEAFYKASASLCPSINIIRVNGGGNNDKLKAFAAADIFCSLSDNIQETFGITPVEAMASGLPVIVSDWNGYKDTIRDGVDGYCIPTFMPESGNGIDFAIRYALEVDNYDMYVGNISNSISVSDSFLLKALYKLITNDKLRVEMGENGIKRVSDEFDWSKIIIKYQNLWSDLSHSRLNSENYNYQWSSRLDPFYAFSAYPTFSITDESKLKLKENNIDLTIKKIDKVKELFIVNYSNYTMPDQKILIRIIEAISDQIISISALKSNLNEIDSTYLTRSIAWMNKFGIVEIQMS